MNNKDNEKEFQRKKYILITLSVVMDSNYYKKEVDI